MPTLNKTQLIGNLTRDLELRDAGSSKVGKGGIAVNRRFTTSDGEKREETVFVDFEVWGNQAEIFAEYTSKGSLIYLEGRLKLDNWEDKDGSKRSKLYLTVDSFQFLDAPPGSTETEKKAVEKRETTKPPFKRQGRVAKTTSQDSVDKDIPF